MAQLPALRRVRFMAAWGLMSDDEAPQVPEQPVVQERVTEVSPPPAEGDHFRGGGLDTAAAISSIVSSGITVGMVGKAVVDHLRRPDAPQPEPTPLPTAMPDAPPYEGE